MSNFVYVKKIKLKYVCFINSETLTEETPAHFELKYIDIGNVDSLGNISEVKDYTFENAPSRARRIVRHGDIVISTVRTYLQAIAVIENPPNNLIVSTGFAVIRPNKNVLDQHFCQYLLRSPKFLAEVEMLSVGVSYPAINVFDLGNILISLPSIKKQQAIANFLDRKTSQLDKLIAAKERLLVLLVEKRRALITQAVTRGLDPDIEMRVSGVEWLGEIPAHWQVVRLKYLVSKIGSGKTPLGGANTYISTGVPLVRSQNVRFEGLSEDDLVFIDEEIDKQMANSRTFSGDVLLNITGASIGRCCLVPKSIYQANVNQHVCVIRPLIKLINNKFLKLFIESEIGQAQVFLGEQGISREGLTFEEIGNFVLLLPVFQEQEKIVAYVEIQTQKLDVLKAATERTISLLKERRVSLIAAAVTGQIAIEETKEETNDCQTITVN